jgi:hypothetical protein
MRSALLLAPAVVIAATGIRRSLGRTNEARNQDRTIMSSPSCRKMVVKKEKNLFQEYLEMVIGNQQAENLVS